MIDDTVGWIIIAIIGTQPRRGSTLNVEGVGLAVGGDIVSLMPQLHRWPPPQLIIRWTNDNFRSEMLVLSAILILMCLMAIVTELIGVHTVLGRSSLAYSSASRRF